MSSVSGSHGHYGHQPHGGDHANSTNVCDDGNLTYVAPTKASGHSDHDNPPERGAAIWGSLGAPPSNLLSSPVVSATGHYDFSQPGADQPRIILSVDDPRSAPGPDNAFAATGAESGAGPDPGTVFSEYDTVTFADHEMLAGLGAGSFLDGGPLKGGQSGDATVGAAGDANTIYGGDGDVAVASFGDRAAISLDGRGDPVTVAGANNEFIAGAGAGHDTISFLTGEAGSSVVGGTAGFTDTVMGFAPSGDDRTSLDKDNVDDVVASSTHVNGGNDTLISMSDGSTILLKGITHIDQTFLS